MKKTLFNLGFMASTSLPILSVIACSGDSKLDKANASIQAVTTATVAAPTMKNKVLYGVTPVSNDINPPVQSGFHFRFKEASAINDEGKTKVTYTVDVKPAVTGSTPKELTFTVGGFETRVKALIRANAGIPAVTTATVAAPTMKNKVLYGVTPVSNDINPPVQSGFHFRFKEASAINDEGKTKVTYTVDVKPAVTGSTPKELTFTVGGFETRVKALIRANASIQAVTTANVIPPTMKEGYGKGWAPAEGYVNPPSKEGFSFRWRTGSSKSGDKASDPYTIRIGYTVDVKPPIDGTTTKDLIFIIVYE